MSHRSVHENSTHSPLLALPAEIRNRIWEYAPGGMRIYPKWIRYQRDHYSDEGTKKKSEFQVDRSIGLLRASSKSIGKLPQPSTE
jgi:hypothetical protein